MKKLLGISLFLGLGLFISSCGSTDVAEKTANTFFVLVIGGEFEKANQLVESGFDAASQLNGVKYIGENEQYGKLLTAKKGMGFNTEVNNGVTTVKLPYELKYQNGTVNAEVVIVDNGAGFKIREVSN